MSRTKKGEKPPGFDIWSKRPGTNKSSSLPSKEGKKRTHRLERLEDKKIVKKEKEEL